MFYQELKHENLRAYRYKGEVIEEFPASLKVLGECEPVYEELPGWNEDITGCQVT